jgi:hypothetical protein
MTDRPSVPADRPPMSAEKVISRRRRRRSSPRCTARRWTAASRTRSSAIAGPIRWSGGWTTTSRGWICPAAPPSACPVRAKQLMGGPEISWRAHPQATVLHLGCGLDSRVFRVDPPPSVRWYDVDQAESDRSASAGLPRAPRLHPAGHVAGGPGLAGSDPGRRSDPGGGRGGDESTCRKPRVWPCCARSSGVSPPAR